VNYWKLTLAVAGGVLLADLIRLAVVEVIVGNRLAIIALVTLGLGFVLVVLPRMLGVPTQKDWKTAQPRGNK
jgi:hypothetical protein